MASSSSSSSSRSSSSSSSSSSEDRKRKRKRKKEKKRKRERKEEKKRKRRKKERKKEKKRRRAVAAENDADLAAADTDQLEAFRAAVQGPRAPPPPSSTNLLALPPAERAAALGLPAGLVRTTARTASITDAASRELFGRSSGMNPATQQRMKRERSAQKALAKAQRVIAARRDKPP